MIPRKPAGHAAGWTVRRLLRSEGLRPLVACAFVMAIGSARAEENRFNVHFETGPLFTVAQPTQKSDDLRTGLAGIHFRLAFEYQFINRLGFELGWSPEMVYTQLSSHASLQNNIVLGFRVKPWINKHAGPIYPMDEDHPRKGGDLLSDVWIDAHAVASSANANRVGYDVGVGVRFAMVYPIQVGAYVRFQHFFAVDNSPNDPALMQVGAGLTFSLGFLPVYAPRDSDGDGVPDAIDRCANTKRGETVNGYGCPVPRTQSAAPKCSDTDLDGVCDGVDSCPDTPLGSAVDEHGCTAADNAAAAEGEK